MKELNENTHPAGGPEPDEEPRREINLDFYYSTRRTRRQPSWPALVAAALMMLGLVLVVIYQDSCGAEISNVLFPGGP